MAWEEFTLSKTFGTRIFRPYSDWLGELQLVIDQLLAIEPALGRKVAPLRERDVAVIVGERMSIVAIASSMKRHLPTLVQRSIGEVVPSDERSISQALGFDGRTSIRLREDSIAKIFEDWGLSEALILAIPSLWSVAPGSEESQIRLAAIVKAAETFVGEAQRAIMERERPKDIFLSHKTANKEVVREVAETLKEFGFSPWLDEDKMPAGLVLERAIDQGFRDSRAAVFFLTPDFVDEGFLATEVDYALRERREKGDRFAIIPLRLRSPDGRLGKVPGLLDVFVWKEVSEIQLVRTILRALPIKADSIGWKQP